MDINQLLDMDKNENITVLIRDPGIYEQYVDYYIGNNQQKHAELESQKKGNDLLPTFLIKDFLEYYKGRQLLLEIERENKILSFA